MVSRITWLVEGTPTSMGMHHYEQRIHQSLMDLAGADWEFLRRTVGGLRSGGSVDIRFPARFRNGGPGWAAMAVGYAHSWRGLSHRFDLRLPPARYEVVTVHDLPPCRFPDEGRLPDWCLASAGRAREVITPSTFARDEVLALTDAKNVTVIPYGLSREFDSPVRMKDEDLTKLGVTKPYVVHAAGATARKNLPALAEAWARIARDGTDHQLVLCGPEHENRTRAFDGIPRVRLLGRQPVGTVAALMTASDGVVVPSIYEGFGLPALEGMACGVPVVAARRGALPEVCGDAAVMVEPDGPGLAEGLAAIFNMSPEARFALGSSARDRAGQFSWDQAAQQHLDVYRRHL